MDIYFLNSNTEAYAVLDTYKSFIWTERYNEAGDFELYSHVTPELVEVCKIGSFVSIGRSNNLMIIERIEFETDASDGDYIKVTGRSLESILMRRIVWSLTTFNGNFQTFVQKIIDDAIINSVNTDRRIPRFRYQASTDSVVTSLTIDGQYQGSTLYEIISSKCKEYKIGFRVNNIDSGIFTFSLYNGTDHSYDQTANPYVIFSTDFENLSSSSYVDDQSTYKNVTLIGGEGEGNDKKYASLGTATGMNRREVFTDASSVSSKKEDGTIISTSEYEKLLKEKGEKTLKDYKQVTGFTGEYSEGSNFIYGRDFKLGDIVEIKDHHGHRARVRISEWIISNEDNSFTQYPTFETIEED